MYQLNRENPAVEVILAVDMKISELGIKKMLKISV